MGMLMIFAVGMVVGAIAVVVVALAARTDGWTEEYIREQCDYERRVAQPAEKHETDNVPVGS